MNLDPRLTEWWHAGASARRIREQQAAQYAGPSSQIGLLIDNGNRLRIERDSLQRENTRLCWLVLGALVGGFLAGWWAR